MDLASGVVNRTHAPPLPAADAFAFVCQTPCMLMRTRFQRSRASHTIGLWLLATALWSCSDDGSTSQGSEAGRDAGRDARGQLDDEDASESPDAEDAVDEDATGTPDSPSGQDVSQPDVESVDIAGEDSGAEDFCGDIDILFVIDSSGSMADNQASLIRSFPGFVEGMRTRLLNAPSFRVGVTTSSDVFNNRAGCTEIGSLVTQTSGPSSSNRNCAPFASGAAWMGHLDTQLEEHFACAAQVGVSGSDDERMMRATLNAISPEFTAPGACNEGFARPDALLVLVLITDEDDVADGCDGTGSCLSYGSGGTPDEWAAELARHRGGSTENVVVLALVGRRPDNPCGAVVNSRVAGFARRFGDAGLVGDVCADSYDAFFTEALPVIADACGKQNAD